MPSILIKQAIDHITTAVQTRLDGGPILSMDLMQWLHYKIKAGIDNIEVRRQIPRKMYKLSCFNRRRHPNQ